MTTTAPETDCAELAAKHATLLRDLCDMAAAMEVQPNTNDLMARLAGLLQLERDIQNLADDYRAENLDALQVVADVLSLNDARAKNQYTRARRGE